ncbi:IAA-amino acid hydrolase ILR1-like 3 [Tetrabaena socialis]|uniref:IAA-amino acid hydrolase ILR1-like 3 n=1 Tax=Tetrabaena socialis TaxID=47790 RepID=A0A2J8A346_9CHLO|nr:IAA-amino acid hydrolase ILR1-like 3 [Tetrabaena socialis]|eukprot:PNH06939.1 IAA-amino acid hydrolase ILR1-like 3 [Tetrabaena socialis]
MLVEIIGCGPDELLSRLLRRPGAQPLSLADVSSLLGVLAVVCAAVTFDEQYIDKPWQEMLVALLVFALRCEPTTAKRSLTLLSFASRLLLDERIFDRISAEMYVYKSCSHTVAEGPLNLVPPVHLVAEASEAGYTAAGAWGLCDLENKTSLVACMLRLGSASLVTSAGGDPRLQLLKQHVESVQQKFRGDLQECLRSSSVIEHCARFAAGLPLSKVATADFSGPYASTVGYQEFKTHSFIVKFLTKYNIPYRYPYGKTGIVAEFGSGKPVVALRADMDGLPIHEAEGVPYRSQHDGWMHACGHDGHMTMALGAARLLREAQEAGELPPGSVNIIFQPAEEGGAGGDVIIQEGERRPPAAAATCRRTQHQLQPALP